MNNNKQTAVEWLVEKLDQNFDYVADTIIKQAKEMGKEQIMEEFDYGDYCIDLPDGTWEQKYKSPEQYYNEEYGK